MNLIHEGMKYFIPSRGCVPWYIFVWIVLFTSLGQLIVEKHDLKETAHV